MAQWIDLPVELMQRVIGMVDEESIVKAGEAELNSMEYKTLQSLSLVDRLLGRLVSPILWHAIDLGQRSLQSLQNFPSVIPPHRRDLIRRVNCVRWDLNETEYISALQGVANVLRLLPGVQHLRVNGDGEWAEYMSTLQHLHSTILTLEFDKETCDLCEEGTLSCLELCKVLENVSIPTAMLAAEGPRVLGLLRSMPRLKSVTLGSLDDITSTELRKTWMAHLSHLHLTAQVGYNPTLVALLNRAGPSLRRLQLDSPAISKTSIPSAFPLQQLTHLILGDVKKSQFSLLPAFAKAPLVQVDLTFAPTAAKEVATDTVISFLRQHEDTVRFIMVEGRFAEWGIEADLTRVCGLKGVELDCVESGV